METKDNLTPEEQKAMDLVKSMIDERIKGVDAVSKETMDLAVKSVKEEISKTTAENSVELAESCERTNTAVCLELVKRNGVRI